jgi:hypothetical protein
MPGDAGRSLDVEHPERRNLIPLRDRLGRHTDDLGQLREADFFDRSIKCCFAHSRALKHGFHNKSSTAYVRAVKQCFILLR